MPSCFIQVRLNGERYESVDHRECDPQGLTTRLLGLIVGYPGENYSEAVQLRLGPREITKVLFLSNRSEQYNGTRIFGKGSQSTGYVRRITEIAVTGHDRRIKVDPFAFRELRAQGYSRWVCHQLCNHYPERKEQRCPLHARAA